MDWLGTGAATDSVMNLLVDIVNNFPGVEYGLAFAASSRGNDMRVIFNGVDFVETGMSELNI